MATPTARALRARNFAQTNSSVTGITVALQQQAAAATSTASASSTSSTSYGTAGSYWGDASGSFSSSWVTWVSIIILAGVVVALLASRFFYIRRYYPPTLRSYLIPAKGIRIRRLGIYIRGPPERIPREPPPSYDVAANGGRRRRRRGRQTVGETVGDGGVRLGERDVDDGWDDLDLVERGARPVDELPRYMADNGLPMYTVGNGSAAEEAERIRARALADGFEDVLPTAAEYEAASRNNRDGHVAPAEGDSTPNAAPAYPPVAHFADSRRPPLNPRATTARSSLLLSAFTRRAPSPAPSASSAAAQHQLSAPHPHDYPPRPSTTSETLDAPDHPSGALRRSASSATSGSSSSSEAGKAGGERKKESGDAAAGGGQANSSTLKFEAKDEERRDGNGH
ncbi:hypothetical protein Rt10032_c15g5466 [Rhodotorula toruloides]|uniref:Uncharacterized protein n=1 Tax=Rhodotorula toruloides TaxID=5286 RepID=A0A511KM36_RHOTO|nr:hypothetical protein Rt10032_c15g5466 [Rhodotorula toruloides]